MQARHLTVHYPPEQSWSRMEVESPKWEDVAPANGGTNEISVPVGFMKQGPVALLTAEMLFEDRRYQARRGGSRTDAGPRDPAVRQGRLPRRSELCRPRAISCATISSCTIARAASSCRPRMGSWKETRLPARQMHALFLTTFPPEGPGAQNVTICRQQHLRWRRQWRTWRSRPVPRAQRLRSTCPQSTGAPESHPYG
jgi:hypothetical protein